MVETPTSAGTPPEDGDDLLDPILSFSETCRFEGVSRWTVRREIKAGRFPSGLVLINGREGWPLSWLKARRKRKSRRASGAETALETGAIA